jgi:thymidylate synthase
VEVFWIAGGREDAALPTHWNPALPRYCGATPTYHGAYGHRLRKHFGIDQLDRVYRALMSAPESRQCVLQLWDSTVDLPQPNGLPAACDIPCNVVAMPKVRAGRLEWMQIIRSNDVFLGLPHNIVQFTALQEMLAGWLGIVPGDYCQMSDSLHIYLRDVDCVRASVDPVASPESTDSFALGRDDWDKVVSDVLSRLDTLARSDVSRSAFRTVALTADVPAAYNNSVLIAAADAARRRNWHDVAEDCARACTNPALAFLWYRWRTRAEGTQPLATRARAVASSG